MYSVYVFRAKMLNIDSPRGDKYGDKATCTWCLLHFKFIAFEYSTEFFLFFSSFFLSIFITVIGVIIIVIIISFFFLLQIKFINFIMYLTLKTTTIPHFWDIKTYIYFYIPLFKYYSSSKFFILNFRYKIIKKLIWI